MEELLDANKLGIYNLLKVIQVSKTACPEFDPWCPCYLREGRNSLAGAFHI